ncbi:MAG: class I SAM-dependent methyltransferase [Devosia sp.]
MSGITSGMNRQYADSSKLAARARLHQEFSVGEPWFPWVMDRLPLKAGDRVLDIGCGPAWFWAASEGRFPNGLHLTLADQSEGMVAEAVGRCTPLGFASVAGQTADVIALPFPDASFDTIVAMHMLYHVGDQAKAVAELHRVLKPGGTLAVTTNGAGNLQQLYALSTTFGSPPVDPAAAAFGFEAAESLLAARFGNVSKAVCPGGLRVTDPEVVFLALTSYPPGDGASDEQLAAFRAAIADAFSNGNGILSVEKETGLFLSRKAA